MQKRKNGTHLYSKNYTRLDRFFRGHSILNDSCALFSAFDQCPGHAKKHQEEDIFMKLKQLLGISLAAMLALSSISLPVLAADPGGAETPESTESISVEGMTAEIPEEDVVGENAAGAAETMSDGGSATAEDQPAVNEEIAAGEQLSDNEESSAEAALTEDDNSDDDLTDNTAADQNQADVPETQAETDQTESAVDSEGEPDAADEVSETEDATETVPEAAPFEETAEDVSVEEEVSSEEQSDAVTEEDTVENALSEERPDPAAEEALEEDNSVSVDGTEGTEEVQDVLYYWGINKDGELRISSKELPQEYDGGAVLPDSGSRNPWLEEGERITSAVIGGEGDIVTVDNVRGWFGGMEEREITIYPFYPNLKSVDLTYLDTSNLTDMSYMFSYSRKLTDVTFGDLDTSNVTNMFEMFSYCTGLNNISFGNMNTSNVEDMGSMFLNCSSLTSLDLSSFDTSNVQVISSMFYGCSKLEFLDLSTFDVSNVRNMRGMFSRCSALSSLDLSGWNADKVQTTDYLFEGCSNLTAIDLTWLSSYDITNTQQMFSNCGKLNTLDLSRLQTSKVTCMKEMFYGCKSLTSLDLSSFDTSNVTDMAGMFSYCDGLTALDLSSFDTSNVSDMADMFSYCSGLPSLDLRHFNTANVMNMKRMFYECRGLTSLDVSSFDTAKTNDMRAMFYYCCALPELDVTNFDTSNVTDFAYMFACLHVLPRIDLSSFDMAKGTSVGGFFTGCKVLKEIISPVAINKSKPIKLIRKYISSGSGIEYTQLPAGRRKLQAILVKGITLNKTTLELSMDGSARITATVTPSDAYMKDVKWSTSDKMVATVTTDGVVKAVGGGRAVITATTKDGGYTATCTVTVRNLPAPILESATCVYDGVTIKWHKVKGATRYRIYRKKPGGSWKKLEDYPITIHTEKTVFSSTDYTAVSGKTYIYTVRCMSHDGSFSVSPYDANGLRITYIETPEIISGTSVLGGIQLKWNKPNGAVRFRVYRRNKARAWAWLADTTATTYTDKTTASGYGYTYTVRCMAADGKSYASSFNHLGTTVLYIAAPKLVSAVKVTGGVKVTWKKPAGAVNFRVYRKSGTGTWKILADTTSLTYTDKSVRSGTTYTYTVRCIRSDGKKSVSMYDYNGKTVKY